MRGNIIERSETPSGQFAYTVQWPDGTETVEYRDEITTEFIKRQPIVANRYGKVLIKGVSLRGMVIVSVSAGMTADELREAAHLFNQLAEALED